MMDIDAADHVGPEVGPDAEVASYVGAGEPEGEPDAASCGEIGAGTMDEGVVMERNLARFELDGNSVLRVEFPIQNLLLQDVMTLPGGTVSEEGTAVRAWNDAKAGILAITVGEGEEHRNGFHGAEGPILCVLMPGDDGAVTGLLDKKMGAPKEKIRAEQAFHVVQDTRMSAEVIDGAIPFVPPIDEIDVLARRQEKDQLLVFILEDADACTVENTEPFQVAFFLVEIPFFAAQERKGCWGHPSIEPKGDAECKVLLGYPLDLGSEGGRFAAWGYESLSL